MKDIKTKEKVLSIKTKDKNANINHFIKKQMITSKKENKQKEESAQVQATNNITTTAKKTMIESRYKSSKFIKQKYSNHKAKLTNQENIDMPTPQKISAVSKAKSHVINKVKSSKIKQTTDTFISKPIIKNTTKLFTKSFDVIKKSATTIKALFSFGSGLILIVVMTLFIGTFGVFAQDGGSNSEILSLSEEVLAYEETITKYATDYGIEDYVSLLEAIMMQESGGKGTDPM